MNSSIPHFLEEILSFFPKISPPVTLTEEVAMNFSAHNKPIPSSILNETFSRWDEFDEYTEIVPCLQLPTEPGFVAMVWWKASLLTHEYIMATIDMEGTLISKKVIAGTISDGSRIIRSVATIDEDNCVFTAAGETDINNNNYTPKNTMAYRFEILPDGIIQSTQEEINQWEEKEDLKQT